MKTNKCMLENKEWGEFEIGKIFDIIKVKGHSIEKQKKGNFPYISTSTENNGLIQFVEKKEAEISLKNCISIDPIKGKAFYHGYDFIGRGFSGASVNLLYNKFLTKNNALFLCRCIEQTSKEKASYGNLFNSYRLKFGKVLLPLDENKNPDWDFMESYMKNLEKEILESTIQYFQKSLGEAENLGGGVDYKNKKWGEFYLKDIFTKIQRGKRLTKKQQVIGTIPYISSTANNNGVDNFIGNTENIRKFRSCLTLANSGSVGKSFYQNFSFIGSDHITALENNKFSKYIYLFLIPLVDKLQDKYSFNREINDKRIKKEKILLPLDDNQKPDWNFMENYMKKKEYETIITYLQSNIS